MLDGMMMPEFPKTNVGLLYYLQEIAFESLPVGPHFEFHLYLILTAFVYRHGIFGD